MKENSKNDTYLEGKEDKEDGPKEKPRLSSRVLKQIENNNVSKQIEEKTREETNRTYFD